jgi:HPt (histidine-containing phosphotransfer) domain-containing protein
MKTNPEKYVDLTYVKALSNGNKDFVNQMIQIFIDQTPETLSTMEMHLGTLNLGALKASAHKMKSSVTIMGIKELEKMINELEEICSKNSGTEQLPEILNKIKSVCLLSVKEMEDEKS